MPEPKPRTGGKRVFFRRHDVLVLAALLLAAGLWLVLSLPGRSGEGKSAGGTATLSWVRTEERAPLVIDLSEARTLSIEGAELPVSLEVANGAIRFVQPMCPDHVCQQAGWLRAEGDWAACLPAGVMLRIDSFT